MAAGHGGKRRGAGRRKGSAHEKTREAADQLAAAGGVSALEVSVTTMREIWKRAQPAGKKRFNLKRAKEAHAIAKDVAPYMHPKLQAIVGDPEKPVIHEHRMNDMQLARAVAYILYRAMNPAAPLPIEQGEPKNVQA